MKEMQRCLIETRSRNLYLENLVEQQRKKLEQIEEMTERAEKQKTERSKEDLHKQVVHDLDKASSDPDPPEVLKKLTEAEEMLIRLREENVNQREELDQLKSFVLKEMRMKYKGCNHPTKLRLSQGSRSTSITRLDISQGFPPLKPITVTPRRTRSMNRGEGSQRDIFNSSFSKQRIHASLPSLQLSRRGTPAHR
ncbi:uncharacterized protein LOC111696553 isoform X2 [Eurytemora carolleeae]|uniref:uncharacterized protein LOC111696553 isoform X2 n=1 Tax=Eurytemora carolleeae TaxID=1294199 RepID=UPI000C790061|nr:uncharacterized protein LOC111696553 isoform X2 [Eurytemora carolleeae]|eukprot:XP_023321951.1 uncharacterized protein LOC111696553 isoform X2 [Eurytemora affinis]